MSEVVDLSDRTAIVTGGASGIGEACARRLGAAGARVIILDVDAEGANRVAQQIGGRGIGVDLSDGHAIDALALDADILVNNAGLQHVAPVQDFPPETWDRIIAVMLTAPFRLIRQVMPGMRERGWGRIVNISSVHGRVASPYKAAYVAAKHGLEGLSKVVALEGGGVGVTSSCIAPGYVRTPLVTGQIADQAKAHGIGEDEVVEQVMLSDSAVKRLIEPEEVADLVAMLCGPLGGLVNGASWAVDGGWTAR